MCCSIFSILNGPEERAIRDREVGGKGLTYNALLRDGRHRDQRSYESHRSMKIHNISPNEATLDRWNTHRDEKWYEWRNDKSQILCFKGQVINATHSQPWCWTNQSAAPSLSLKINDNNNVFKKNRTFLKMTRCPKIVPLLISRLKSFNTKDLDTLVGPKVNKNREAKLISLQIWYLPRGQSKLLVG